jgi:hypothetical protein
VWTKTTTYSFGIGAIDLAWRAMVLTHPEVALHVAVLFHHLLDAVEHTP